MGEAVATEESNIDETTESSPLLYTADEGTTTEDSSSSSADEDIVADSSFYICLACDLERKDWLYKFMRFYSFYLGKRILKELPKSLTDDKNFMLELNIDDYDYYGLIEPIFGRDPRHKDDGEYEAIGIAHYLEAKGSLRYLILDDSRSRNFVKRHFPLLKDYLVGTIGFIRDCCCCDRKISAEQAINILTAIRVAVEEEKETRPCSMDEKNYQKILIPAIQKIKRCFDE